MFFHVDWGDQMPLPLFADAIADSEIFTKRHLLLGNGFSIACRADVFHYGSLFAQANCSAAPEVVSVFDALGTQDFEAAIHALENAARILPAYLGHGVAAQAKMIQHAATLKEILVQTIAGNHPHIPLDIPDARFWACRRFLSYFLSSPKAGAFSSSIMICYFTGRLCMATCRSMSRLI